MAEDVEYLGLEYFGTEYDDFEGYDTDMIYIMHEGRGHDDLTEEGFVGRSGRYEYGSGKVPYQHAKDFLQDIAKYRFENEPFIDAKGRTWTGETAVAKRFGLRTASELKAQESVARYEAKLDEYYKVWFLCGLKNEDGTPKYNDTQIAKRLGYPHESSVRNIRKNRAKLENDSISPIADALKKQCDEGTGLVDVGKYAEKMFGCSKHKMEQALAVLNMQGYKAAPVRIKQAGSQNSTTVLVLRRPDMTYANAHEMKDKIEIANYKLDGNTHTVNPVFVRPKSVDHNRIFIRYGDDEGDKNGKPKDGLIEIRRGVPDLDLRGSHYCQVRINVDDTHYIKGMACYSDDVPEGYDMIVNSNKPREKGWQGALKPMKHVGETDDHPAPVGAPVDWDNPFKTLITPGIYDPDNPNENVNGGQSYYYDPVTGKKELSAINKRSDEGEWAEWSKELPSQFLSKQPKKTIERQLKLTKEQKQREFDEIMSLTNPTVRKFLLDGFATTCDSGSYQLKAASVPNARYHVLLPAPSIKDGECFAPNYYNGTKLALVRFPHSGTFEIPYLTVNNNNQEAIDLYTREAKDMVAINPKAAAQLSGADFDGDTALTIPITDKFDVAHRPYLEGLVDFDMDALYKLKLDDNGNIVDGRPGAKLMKKSSIQLEMGSISNLITDMTLAGANDEELTRAVKHSMVVIDAFKHKYDYKLSEKDNDIKSLKEKYQKQIFVDPETGKTRVSTGAGTIISRSSKEKPIPKTQGSGVINPETGKVEKKLADDLYYYTVKWKEPVLDINGKQMYRKNGQPIMKNREADAFPDANGNWFRYGENELDETGKPIRRANGLYKKVKVPIKEGEEIQQHTRMVKVPWMSVVDDARELVNGNEKEYLYADYANLLKSLANKSRLEIIKKNEARKDPEAAKKYANEVNSLRSQLDVAQKNAPFERQALRRMREIVNKQLLEDPTLNTAGDRTKLEAKAMVKARAEIGAKRTAITISDKEWEAIQAHALAKSELMEIFKYVDEDRLKQLAMPRETESIPENKMRSFMAMINQTAVVNGKITPKYTNAQLAEHFGVSVATINKYRNQ